MLFVVNEGFKFGCADSTKKAVDLSGLNPSVCFTINKSTKNKAVGKSVFKSVSINVTAATGIVKTSLIDGTTVTFVSAVGSIVGNSKKYKAEKMPVCLADSSIQPATAAAYSGDGTIGTLTVTGTNSSSGATVTDVCTIWFSDAGQNKVKAA